jgi:hypothetical protein
MSWVKSPTNLWNPTAQTREILILLGPVVREQDDESAMADRHLACAQFNLSDQLNPGCYLQSANFDWR